MFNLVYGPKKVSYVVNQDKRLVKERDRVILYPENPAYKPQVITADMDFEVWGVVTCVLHRV